MDVKRTALKVRNILLRNALKLALQPGRPKGMVRLGTEYGGWWVPADALQPGHVAYCAGAGEDISFDLALHEAGLVVRTFDPTPRAIAYVQANAPKDDRFTFDPVGWWRSADTLRFYAPANPSDVSHSAVNLQRTETFFEAPVDTVAALKSRHGDASLHLVKMDIEGAEHAVLDQLLADGVLPAVICVEFDQPSPVLELLRMVRQLSRHGYALRAVEAWNYTFAR
jgi:FkbM family methyltransferase